jgi:RNA polymerase sigma-70 factor (ECF subfamily)
VHAAITASGELDIESVFRTYYGRLTGLISRVVRQRARAEEIAVEVILKWSRSGVAADRTEPWLLRAAAAAAIDELRRRERRWRRESWFGFLSKTPATPYEAMAAADEVSRVRAVLAKLAPRAAEMLLLRADGASYDEVAAALEMNAASVGTTLRRAQEQFRKEYVALYGERTLGG